MTVAVVSTEILKGRAIHPFPYPSRTNSTIQKGCLNRIKTVNVVRCSFLRLLINHIRRSKATV